MATYITGPSAAGDGDGSSWDNRLGGLNAAEDIPVVAGDTVICGPGVYREQLTLDVSGGAGTEITYIGDVTGRLTDGVGGTVRITASDDDRTSARLRCIQAGAPRSYRTFRGFMFDMGSSQIYNASDAGTNGIIEDCVMMNGEGLALRVLGASQSDWTIRRCLFYTNFGRHIFFSHSSPLADINHVVENCIFFASGNNDSIEIDDVGGITIRHCTFIASGDNHVNVVDSAGTGAGQFTTVEYCQLISSGNNALRAQVLGDIIEDHNNLFGNDTDRLNVAVGANSVAFAPLFRSPLLLDDYRLPVPLLSESSQWSELRRFAGTSTATDDLFGFARPATAAKLSWGAIQYQGQFRDADTTFDSSTASLRLDDAGRHHKFVPSSNTPTVITCQVYREGDYAGNLPQMIISQPGRADVTATATGGVGTWEQLQAGLTPEANPPWFTVNLISRNTAGAGNFSVYFDKLDVR